MSTPAATVPMQVGGFGGDMGRDRKPESITSCSPSRDEGNKGAGKPEGKKKKKRKCGMSGGVGGVHVQSLHLGPRISGVGRRQLALKGGVHPGLLVCRRNALRGEAPNK